jgi:hypothetical protein
LKNDLKIINIINTITITLKNKNNMLVKAGSLNLSKVTFSDIKTDNHGRKMVYINLDNGKIMVQTPKMYAPNGIKRWRKKDAIDNKDDKFEMELSFYGENGTDKNAQELRDFHQKWQEFDTLIKKKVIEKAKEWLGMPKLDMNTLESVMYTPMVKIPKDKEGNELPYPSRVRAKIDREIDTNGNSTGRFLSNKKFKTEVLLFDDNKTKLDLNEDNAETLVPKGSQVVCILELVYLSLSKTTISTKWKLVQAKVFKNKDTITGYAMLDDDDDQEDLDTNEETSKKQELNEQNQVDAVVEEEEDDEEDENKEVEDEEDVEEDDEQEDVEEEQDDEEDIPEPEPPKPVVKPKGRAKRGVGA